MNRSTDVSPSSATDGSPGPGIISGNADTAAMADTSANLYAIVAREKVHLKETVEGERNSRHIATHYV